MDGALLSGGAGIVATILTDVPGVSIIKLPSYLSNNFRWLSYFFGKFSKFCTNSFVRSFASSIGIMRSSLVISKPHSELRKNTPVKLGYFGYFDLEN